MFYFSDFKQDWGAKGKETAEEGDDGRGLRRKCVDESVGHYT